MMASMSMMIAAAAAILLCMSGNAHSTESEESEDREKLTEALLKQYPKNESTYINQCKAAVSSLARTYEKKISNTETFCACHAKMMYLERAFAVRNSLVGQTPAPEGLRKLLTETTDKVNQRAMKECPTE
jgi:ABC-type Zn uptake system ZnuABC Zn-binding protein ZnuA